MLDCAFCSGSTVSTWIPTVLLFHFCLYLQYSVYSHVAVMWICYGNPVGYNIFGYVPIFGYVAIFWLFLLKWLGQYLTHWLFPRIVFGIILNLSPSCDQGLCTINYVSMPCSWDADKCKALLPMFVCCKALCIHHSQNTVHFFCSDYWHFNIPFCAPCLFLTVAECGGAELPMALSASFKNTYKYKSIHVSADRRDMLWIRTFFGQWWFQVWFFTWNSKLNLNFVLYQCLMVLSNPSLFVWLGPLYVRSLLLAPIHVNCNVSSVSGSFCFYLQLKTNTNILNGFLDYATGFYACMSVRRFFDMKWMIMMLWWYDFLLEIVSALSISQWATKG